MNRKFLILIAILAVAVILVSGCTQQEEPGPSGGEGEISSDIGLGADVSEAEESLSDLDLSDLDTIGADLDEVISALE